MAGGHSSPPLSGARSPPLLANGPTEKRGCRTANCYSRSDSPLWEKQAGSRLVRTKEAQGMLFATECPPELAVDNGGVVFTGLFCSLPARLQVHRRNGAWMTRNSNLGTASPGDCKSITARRPGSSVGRRSMPLSMSPGALRHAFVRSRH